MITVTVRHLIERHVCSCNPVSFGSCITYCAAQGDEPTDATYAEAVAQAWTSLIRTGDFEMSYIDGELCLDFA